jgi:DNA polymerase III epsilon subunit-like protein
VQFDESDADPSALTKNRYHRESWCRHALPAPDAATRFAAFLRRHATVDRLSRTGRPYRLAQLVAHNAERFDGPLIHGWFRNLDRFCPATYSVFCTKQRAYWLFQEYKHLTPPANFQLATLCQFFGVPLSRDDRHNALNDVWATVELYRAMRECQKNATIRRLPCPPSRAVAA